MKSEHESVDTKSTQDKKKICEACQKRETEKVMRKYGISMVIYHGDEIFEEL